jgi:hypothetical protein
MKPQREKGTRDCDCQVRAGAEIIPYGIRSTRPAPSNNRVQGRPKTRQERLRSYCPRARIGVLLWCLPIRGPTREATYLLSCIHACHCVIKKHNLLVYQRTIMLSSPSMLLLATHPRLHAHLPLSSIPCGQTQGIYRHGVMSDHPRVVDSFTRLYHSYLATNTTNSLE